MNPFNRILTILVVALSGLGASYAQDGVPQDILNRTLFIKTDTREGTAFAIDRNGKVYLVTARHMVEGLPTENPSIKIRKGNDWQDFHPLKILFPENPDVDIAVFTTDQKAEKPYYIGLAGDHGGVTLGQQVWFLGYPFIEGLGTLTPSFQAPFIKRGTMSAIVGTRKDAVMFYIDGFNNEGFSGGPILYWDFTDHVYRILGVVQGYKFDQAHVEVNGKPVPTPILTNSGILIAYSIQHAIDAIEKDAEK